MENLNKSGIGEVEKKYNIYFLIELIIFNSVVQKLAFKARKICARDG